MSAAPARLRTALVVVLAGWCQDVPPSLLPSVIEAQAAGTFQSVWVEDYSADRLKGAASAGKTTVIFAGGSSLDVKNHVEVARYVVRRVAEELTNALVLPLEAEPIPSAAGSTGGRDRGAEIVNVVNRGVRDGAFRDVVIIADEDISAGSMTLAEVANALDREWRPKGVRVHYVTAHEIRPGQGMAFNSDYLRRWASRTVPASRRKSVEDFSELLFVDREGNWLTAEMVPQQDRTVVSAELGKVLVEQRVSSILNQIRELSPRHVR